MNDKCGHLLDCPPFEIIMLLVTYAYVGAFVLATVFVFWGGISFMFAGGNDEKIKVAVNTIRYAILGLIVTIISFVIIGMVGNAFGFKVLERYFTYTQIIENIERLVPSDNEQNQYKIK